MTTVKILKQLLADTYALYLKTQNYHWNVTGPNFKPLHLMFEEHYLALALTVDVIAERIRALGEKAPASFSQYAALTKIEEGSENSTAEEMLKNLAIGHQHVVGVLYQVKEAAEKENDAATENMVDDQLQSHQKIIWMLKASLA